MAAAAPAASSPQVSALIAAAAAVAPALPSPSPLRLFLPLLFQGLPRQTVGGAPPPQRTRPSRSPFRSALERTSRQRRGRGRREPCPQHQPLSGTPRPPPPLLLLQPPLVIFLANQHGVCAELRKGDTARKDGPNTPTPLLPFSSASRSFLFFSFLRRRVKNGPRLRVAARHHGDCSSETASLTGGRRDPRPLPCSGCCYGTAFSNCC